MSKIGLFFGTDTGNTETVSENLIESLTELTLNHKVYLN